MGKFAKLFEVENEQVLIYTEQNAKGNPTIKIVTEIDGVEASVNIEFGTKDENKPFDLEKAWDRCDKTFNLMDEEDAIGLRNKMVEGFLL